VDYDPEGIAMLSPKVRKILQDMVIVREGDDALAALHDSLKSGEDKLVVSQARLEITDKAVGLVAILLKELSGMAKQPALANPSETQPEKAAE
jgi:hypothetical protein